MFCGESDHESLPNPGTGYVLHLLGDGTQEDAEYLLDFVYSTQRAARCMS